MKARVSRLRKKTVKKHVRHLKGKKVEVKTHARRSGMSDESSVKKMRKHRKDVKSLTPHKSSGSRWEDHSLDDGGAEGNG